MRARNGSKQSDLPAAVAIVPSTIRSGSKAITHGTMPRAR
jgi:hypothetical protein